MVEIAGVDPKTMGVPYDHLSVEPEQIRGWGDLMTRRSIDADPTRVESALSRSDDRRSAPTTLSEATSVREPRHSANVVRTCRYDAVTSSAQPG
jgi:hypothetical protein